jgi:hypothetical protein
MSCAALKTIRSRAPLSGTAIADLPVWFVRVHSMTAVIEAFTMTAVIVGGDGSASM